MNSQPNLDQLRATALARIDKKERQVKGAIAAAAMLEGAGLILFIALADFSNRTHVLILVSAILVYGTLTLGLVALAAYVGQCAQRVLKAVELLAPRSS